MTFADVDWLRHAMAGPLVVKGVQRVDDALAVVAAGADGVALSNHGGRQLDRAVAPLDLLPSRGRRDRRTRRGLSRRRRSLGRRRRRSRRVRSASRFVARPYLYALMAGGERGVDHLASLLRNDYIRTLRLLGVTSTADLERDLVDVKHRASTGRERGLLQGS